MREIKFRAWGPNVKYMWPWEELKHIPVGSLDCGEKIVMQFTGLLDKSGKEIYEGDILYNPFSVGSGEIIWSEYHACWCLGDEDSWPLNTYNLPEFWEIVGNIYEKQGEK